MFTVTKNPPGTFRCADCSSTDASKARQFYLDLMGWSSHEIPMGNGMNYTMFTQDGHDVAAISPMHPDEQAQGMPSHWNSYITVDDVDALTDKIVALGGTVMAGPYEVLDSGRMLVLQDPTGAAVALWQPRAHIGAGLVNIAGAMTWNELATRDPGQAQAFYGALLGWTFEKDPNNDYYYIRNRGRMNGGILPMSAEWGDIPAHWMVYFTVNDASSAAARVKELGGTVHVPGMDTTAGRFIVVGDPAGAICSLIQSTQPQPWEE